MDGLSKLAVCSGIGLLAVALGGVGGCGSEPLPTANPQDAAAHLPDGADGGLANPACAAWATGLGAGSVPSVTDKVATQRAALLSAGGGLAPVGSKYYAAYFPASFAAAARKRVIVALHGTGGSPEAEWNDYRSAVEARGWGFLALKYLDDTTGNYDTDETIYANLTKLIADAKANCDLADAQFFLVGFSRGAAKTFSMAYSDNQGPHLFTAFGPQSGGAWQQPSGCAWTSGGKCAWQAKAPVFPSKCAEIAPAAACDCKSLTTSAPSTPDKPAFAKSILDAGDTKAYTGTRFWLYCAERDYESGFRNCDDMEMSKAFVEAFGGHVDTLYVAGATDGCPPWTGTDCITVPDTKCGHGSWKNVSKATESMWNYFESL